MKLNRIVLISSFFTIFSSNASDKSLQQTLQDTVRSSESAQTDLKMGLNKSLGTWKKQDAVVQAITISIKDAKNAQDREIVLNKWLKVIQAHMEFVRATKELDCPSLLCDTRQKHVSSYTIDQAFSNAHEINLFEGGTANEEGHKKLVDLMTQFSQHTDIIEGATTALAGLAQYEAVSARTKPKQESKQPN